MSDKNSEPIDEEFLKALKESGDCPEKIFKLAKSDFEKQVAIEFFRNSSDHKVIAEKLGNLEKLLYAILGGTGVIGIGFIVKTIIDVLTKVP